MAATTPFLQLHKFGDLDLAEIDLKLRAFRGREALSSLFQFQLHLHFASEQASELDHEQFLGKRAVYSVDQTNFFSGIISSVAVTGLDDEGRCHLAAVLVPELWKLSEIHDSRRHKKAPVAMLVGDLLKEFSLDLKLVDKTDRNVDAHPPRTNPVQYDESVYNFLARHMQEEGIFYYLQEDYKLTDGEAVGQQTLVLGDGPHDYHEPEEPLVLQFQPTGNVVSPETIIHWQRQFRYRPGQWSISDYNYHNSRDFSMAKQAVGGSNQFRKFKRSAGFYNPKYGEHLQRRMDERESVAREFLDGSSLSSQLFPGCVFKLQGHPIGSENGSYIVTSVEHSGMVYESVDGMEREYESAFTCVPAGRVPVVCPNPATIQSPLTNHRQGFRGSSVGAAYDSSPYEDPTIAAGPIPGYENTNLSPKVVAETAFVVDASGNYDDSETVGTVHTRTQGDTDTNTGEVQVKFAWETAAETDRWLRVAQLTAGNGWGTKFLPRVGEEVIVMYIDGQEKKPLVVGSVYNSATQLNNPANSEIVVLGIEEKPPFNRKEGEPGYMSSPGSEFLASLNADNNATVAAPSLNDNNVSGFRSRTNDADTSGCNELLFNDTPNDEQIYIHAERDLNIKVENDLNIEVGGNKREIIRGDYYRVANVGPASNAARKIPSAQRYKADGKNKSDGGVIRTIIDGVDYDHDKVWEVWTVQTFESGSPTTKLGSSHLASDGDATYYLVKTETYADEEDLNVGDTKETFVGNFEEHFYGRKYEDVVGDEKETEIPTIETHVQGYKKELFQGKSNVEYKGVLTETYDPGAAGGSKSATYTGISVTDTYQGSMHQEYHIGCNTFTFYLGSKEEIMVGLALDVFVGSKAEFIIGNLLSIHKGSKYEIAPAHNTVNAKWAMHVGSFGAVALKMGLSALKTEIAGRVNLGAPPTPPALEMTAV